MGRVIKSTESKYGCPRLRGQWTKYSGFSYWCGSQPIVSPSINCKDCKHETYDSSR